MEKTLTYPGTMDDWKSIAHIALIRCGAQNIAWTESQFTANLHEDISINLAPSDSSVLLTLTALSSDVLSRLERALNEQRWHPISESEALIQADAHTFVSDDSGNELRMPTLGEEPTTIPSSYHSASPPRFTAPPSHPTVSVRRVPLYRRWWIIGLICIALIAGALVIFHPDKLSLSRSDKTEEHVMNQQTVMSQAKSISYEELSRYPDRYQGQMVKVSGTVIQANGDTQFTLSQDEWYSQVILVTFSGNLDNGRVLQDDQVTFYGTAEGIQTYAAIMGQTLTVPKVKALYYTIDSTK